MAAILQFVRGDASVFDEHATHAMGQAFDAACAELQDGHLSKLVREMMAGRIVAAAKRGERDPQRLCGSALAGIGGERNARKDVSVRDDKHRSTQ
jgi:hypothetical protein